MIQKYIIDKTDMHDLLTGKEIPLPQGSKARAFCVEISGELTNGEVIQALFPEVKVEINGFLVRCVFIEHEFTTLLEWWNAPYKTESEKYNYCNRCKHFK